MQKEVKFGNINRPQDYFTGTIKFNEKEVSNITGTYMGYMEFDGIRYWDARDFQSFPVIESKNCLPSDSRFRPDLRTLALGDVPNAQKRKEEMEIAQRKDAKLRAEAAKQIGRAHV